MLLKRAAFNSISAFLDQGARILVVIVLTPILLTALGPVLFGFWQVLQRAASVVIAFDGRSSELLKWQLAGIQTAEDRQKQQVLSNAVWVWLCFIPVLLLLALLTFTYLPAIMALETADINMARNAGYIIVVNILLLGFIALLEAALRGMNLGYKRMGLRTFFILLGGVLAIWAATEGYGLIGIAAAQSVNSAIYAIALFLLIGKHIPWFGLIKTHQADVVQSAKSSIWFMQWEFIAAGLFLGDVILLGIFGGTALVAQYVVSSYIIQTIMVVVTTVVAATLPGIGKILSEKNYQRVCDIRDEGNVYIWLLVISVGSAVIVANQSFVNLWVGKDQFVGAVENVLILLTAIQLTFIRQDATFINLAVDIKSKVLIGAIALTLSAGLSAIFVPLYGIAGLCASLIAGRLVLTLAYPRIIYGFLKTKSQNNKVLLRIMLIASGLLAGFYYLSQYFIDMGLLKLIAVSILTFICSLLVLFVLALNKKYKAVLWARVLAVVRVLGVNI